MRKLIFRLHLYIGLVAGLFPGLLGITGSIIAFEPEPDHLLHHRLSYVKWDLSVRPILSSSPI